MATLTELTAPLTADEIKTAIYAAIAAEGTSTTNWKPSSVVRTIIAIVAAILAAFSTLSALLARAGFLSTSSGYWLTLVAWYVWGVARVVATYATADVTLVNATGNEYTLDPGDLILANSTTGKTYVNTDTVVIGGLATVTDVPVVAQESGSGSSAIAGAIDTITTGPLNVTVTNPSAAVGLDDESDTALIARCLSSLVAASPNGAREAYSYFARNAVRSVGTSIGVTRTRVFPSTTTGQVSIYVATPSGGVSGTVGNLNTDLGALDDYLQRNVVPLCVVLTTASAVEASVPVTYEAWVYDTGLWTEVTLEAAVETALAAKLALEPIGGHVIGSAVGKVFAQVLESTINATASDIFKVEVSGSDVELDEDEVPVLGTVTATINFIEVPA
jgi:hypothetical protein